MVQCTHGGRYHVVFRHTWTHHLFLESRALNSRRLVSELTQQESLDQIFLASQKQLRSNRNGNLYLQVELSDRSGTVTARMWNANESDYRRFEDGDFVRVEGTAQLFQGAMQVIASSISRASGDEVDPADFMPLSPAEIDALIARLSEMLRSMADPHLRTLAECMLIDEPFMARFTRAPAGVKHHHAYLGGLLQHVVDLMTVVKRVSPCYPAIDPDLLLMGAFVHDIGKLDELRYDRGLSYSDEGQLIGHLVMGVAMIDRFVAQAEKLGSEPMPQELVLRLKHMIVSHHGQYEFGSPKLPMTLEAVALAQLDNLDAKVHSFEQQMREDPNIESGWTSYNPSIGRKLFKGSHEAVSRDAAESHP